MGKPKAARRESTRPATETTTTPAPDRKDRSAEDPPESPEDRRRKLPAPKTTTADDATVDAAAKPTGPGFTQTTGPGFTQTAVPGFTQGMEAHPQQQQSTATEAQTVQVSGSEPLAGSDRLPKFFTYASCIDTTSSTWSGHARST